MSEDNTSAPVADTSNTGTPNLETAVSEAISEATGQSNDTSTQAKPEQTAAQKVAEKKRINKLKLKIDGREMDEELPFFIDEDQADWYRNTLQMSKKAHKSMQEKAEYESQVENLAKLSKADRKEFLRVWGIDPKDLAREVVEEEVRNSQMTPEQKRVAELEAQLEKIKKESEKKEAEAQAEKRSLLEKQITERIQVGMLDSLQKAGLPQDELTMSRVARYMYEAHKRGLAVTPEEVVPIVQKDIYNEMQRLIKALGEDKVEEFMGKDVLARIRKANIAKSKATTAATAKVQDTGKTSKTEEPKKEEKIQMRDFFGRL